MDEDTKTKEAQDQEQASSVEESTESTVAEQASEASSNEEVKEEVKAKPVKKASADLEKIIESIEKLTVLELADLVHALEDRFGVTAAAPVAVAGATPTAAAGEPAEEKTNFDVILTSAGANKIAVIKAVREIVPTLGLKEAKDLVEAAPKTVLEGANKASSDEAKLKLTAAGGTVELK